ncbi:tail assembly chaperone [Lysinibacillus xylanilyticus]|uniref:tail assembly chaperone n=1 Tax=Lysinibacillus xylanilyticus TaxID=582475 RepID=UPI002B2507C2|nr:tail assembly chaperone [Lysinibacillus xylanilyticus]MEB2279662.1 tail assembly chaperone [Lysinibacillus xylanilyticus]
MATLTIDNKQYDAKFGFAFKNLADKNYNETDKEGNETGGFIAIYQGLLQFNIDALKAFWDCGLAHLGSKGRPAIKDIEKALEDRIEEDGDTEKLFKEAFKEINLSGFFKKDAKTFWKNLDMFKEIGTEQEQAENEKAVQMLLEAKAELEDATVVESETKTE